MRFHSILLVLILIISCGQKIAVQDLNHLNGYWEIKKVEFPDGSSKEYEINTTVDFFEYSEMKGFRKKVQPKLDGSFTTSDDAENFEVITKKDKFIVLYSNNLSQWEEEIRSITAHELVVVNSEGITYHYNRFGGKSAH